MIMGKEKNVSIHTRISSMKRCFLVFDFKRQNVELIAKQFNPFRKENPHFIILIYLVSTFVFPLVGLLYKQTLKHGTHSKCVDSAK